MEQAIELAIVFVVLAPFLRLMTSPPFLRRLGRRAPSPGDGRPIMGQWGSPSLSLSLVTPNV